MIFRNNFAIYDLKLELEHIGRKENNFLLPHLYNMKAI